MSVVIFIFGGVCAYELPDANSANSAATKHRLVFIFSSPTCRFYYTSFRSRSAAVVPYCTRFSGGAVHFAIQGLFLRPVKAHVHDKGPVRRGQPVGFLIFAG